MVATGIDVDGWGEGLYVESLFDAPSNPVLLGAEDGDVLLAEMVPIFAGVLEHGRLVLAKTIGGSGGVVMETC